MRVGDVEQVERDGGVRCSHFLLKLERVAEETDRIRVIALQIAEAAQTYIALGHVNRVVRFAGLSCAPLPRTPWVNVL